MRWLAHACILLSATVPPLPIVHLQVFFLRLSSVCIGVSAVMRAVILLLWRLGVVHIRDILLLLGVWSRIIGSYSLICAIAPSTPAQTFASIARWLPLSLPLRFNAIRTFPASAAVDIAVDVRSPPPCDGNEKSNSNKVISEQSKESRSRRSSHSSRSSRRSRAALFEGLVIYNRSCRS